jgi:hypothetical protein
MMEAPQIVMDVQVLVNLNPLMFAQHQFQQSISQSVLPSAEIKRWCQEKLVMITILEMESAVRLTVQDQSQVGHVLEEVWPLQLSVHQFVEMAISMGQKSVKMGTLPHHCLETGVRQLVCSKDQSGYVWTTLIHQLPLTLWLFARVSVETWRRCQVKHVTTKLLTISRDAKQTAQDQLMVGSVLEDQSQLRWAVTLFVEMTSLLEMRTVKIKMEAQHLGMDVQQTVRLRLSGFVSPIQTTPLLLNQLRSVMETVWMAKWRQVNYVMTAEQMEMELVVKMTALAQSQVGPALEAQQLHPLFVLLFVEMELLLVLNNAKTMTEDLPVSMAATIFAK